MAERQGTESLRDQLDSLASRKQLTDVFDRLETLTRELKAVKESVIEAVAEIRKDNRKTLDAVEAFTDEEEAADPRDEDEPPEYLKPILGQVGQLIEFGKSMMGEDDIKGVVKDRIKGFLRKKAEGE
jgi:hypothetical protein